MRVCFAGGPLARRPAPLVLLSLLLWAATGTLADTRIAFTSRADGNAKIYLTASDGGGLTRLTEQAGVDIQPTWSPDGSQLAFVSDRDGNRDIWRMNVDGGEQTRLTQTVAGETAVGFSHPVWFPGIRGIVCQSEPSDPAVRTELWLIAPDGTRQRSMSSLSNHDDIIHPARGLYGLVAVVVSRRNHPTSILTYVTYEFEDVIGYWDFPLDLRNIDATSDGRIAFDADGDIWITDWENLYEPINITDSPNVAEANPSWSPDGTRVAFEADGWIVTTAADGSDLRRVVEGADPAWSPQLEATAVTPSEWGRVKREVVDSR